MKTINPHTQIGRMYLLLSINRKNRVGLWKLHQVSGSLCVSTKISELRNGYGLNIENKTVRQKNGLIYSYYRLKGGKAKKQ